jgi:hypothetical protein
VKNLTVDKRWEIADWNAWCCREWFMRAKRDEMEAKANNAEAWISVPKQTRVLKSVVDVMGKQVRQTLTEILLKIC